MARSSTLVHIGPRSGKYFAVRLYLDYADKHRDGLDIGGMPARQYLKEVAYCEAIPEFRSVLKQIGEEQGWTLEELQAMFSNKLWDYIVFS